jgi:hypothetical protein
MSQFSRFVFEKAALFARFWRQSRLLAIFRKKKKNHSKVSFTFATILYFWNNMAFSTATQLPATTALPIPSVGCATRHPDLPILRRRKRTETNALVATIQIASESCAASS